MEIGSFLNDPDIIKYVFINYIVWDYGFCRARSSF